MLNCGPYYGKGHIERADKGQGLIRNQLWGYLPSGHGGKIYLGNITGTPSDGRVNENTILPNPRGVITHYSIPL